MTAYRESSFKVVRFYFLWSKLEMLPNRSYLKNFSSLSACSPMPTWAFNRLEDLNLFFSLNNIDSHSFFLFQQQLPLALDVVFWAAAIRGCFVATRGVPRSLILSALIQSDSDRRIKMQILARALLAILSLPFSLCGMLRGAELERWPWG